MKMVAIPYLHAAVGNHVREIFEDKRSLEVDPSKGGKPDNVQALLAYVDKFCNSIFTTVDACPK